MAELKNCDNINCLNEIKSPTVLYIIATIKNIQKRMKEPDLTNCEYIRVYDVLGREFRNFADSYTSIFTKVIRGENLSTIATILYYKDQIDRNLLTEQQLSQMLASKYLPENLRQESENNIKNMIARGEVSFN